MPACGLTLTALYRTLFRRAARSLVALEFPATFRPYSMNDQIAVAIFSGWRIERSVDCKQRIDSPFCARFLIPHAGLPPIPAAALLRPIIPLARSRAAQQRNRY